MAALGFSTEAENLPQVVDQTRQDEPTRAPVSSNSFRCLKEMLDLRKVRIKVTVVDQEIEILHRLSDVHGVLLFGKIFCLFFRRNSRV